MDLMLANVDGIRHIFHIMADGDRPILEIHVDATPGAETLPILINAVGAPVENAQRTKGLTVIDSIPSTDSDGMPTGMTAIPNVMGIASYIVPRIHTMMARVYVPKVNVSSE